MFSIVDRASNNGRISEEDLEILIKFLLLQLLKHKEMLYELTAKSALKENVINSLTDTGQEWYVWGLSVTLVRLKLNIYVLKK